MKINMYQVREDIQNIFLYEEEACISFLRNNYGLKGVDKNGFTSKAENRTIENMRLECISQYLHNLKDLA